VHDQAAVQVVAGRKHASALTWFLLAVIVLAGTYLRVVATFNTNIDQPIWADARDYWVYAVNLSESGVFSRKIQQVNEAEEPTPDAVRAPGYPFMMATVMRLLPQQHWYGGVLWLQIVLGVGVIVLTFVLFRSLLPPLWALIPTGLTAVSPHLIMLGAYLLSETLFAFSLLVMFLFIRRHIEQPGMGTAFFSGTLVGLITLIRAGLQYFSVPLALLYMANAPRAKRARVGTVFMLGFVIIVGAWGVRNLAVIDKWSDSTLQINFLHHGMYPGFMYRSDPATLGRPYRFDPTSGQINRTTGTILNEIWRRLRDEPARHVTWYLLVKPLSFWSWGFVQGSESIFIYPVRYSPYHDQSVFVISRGFMRALHWPLVVLMLLGSVLVWLPGVRQLATVQQVFLARAISLMLVYYTAIHVVGMPFPRYAVPLKPFLYGMAVVACSWLYRRLADRHS
jgi:hypothetical protein